MKTCVDDMFDVDSDAAVQSDERRSGGSAPLTHRQMVTSQDATAAASETVSGLTEEAAGAQSSAIDMSIGIKVPAVPSKLPHVPVSPSFNHHHHHHHHTSWPQSISQPLSNKFTHSLCPTLSPTTSSSSSRPSHACRTLGFSLQPSASGQTAPLHGTSTFNPSKHLEPQLHLPKESPRKRMAEEEPGHVPEVKAIQQTRRLLANARERTRVHTISAAFEALRKQVPCYSYGQKLSKLAILRIACNYILSLAQLAEQDYGEDCSSPSFSQCVEQCTRTLQAEGRSKKRKE